jgi:tRNA A-37 threonylcarbamoyl transferase component Bud32
MGPVNGRYRVIDEIGRGGMAIIWRGYDEVLDRPVAIKVLASGYADDQAFRQRIRREARAAARLSHPHVGTVYDFGEASDGRPYLVMELISGRSLADRLREAPLPCAQALRVCAQIASALAETHARGLVHRDVKPSNIMLTPSGAKLVDFGISTMINEGGDATQGVEADPPQGLPGMLLGTPAYVAPEVVAGCTAGAPADVYALGMLLYRTLTGRLPWSVETPEEVLRAHMLVQPHPLPPLPGLPPEIARLSLRCLAKDPADRPTGAELARDWAAAAHAATAAAPTASAAAAIPPSGRHTAARPRRRVMAAALLLGVLAFSATAAFTTSTRPTGRVAASARATPAAPLTCNVLYRLQSDDGHVFAGALTVRNTGTRPLPASTLTFSFTGSQHIAGRSFAQSGTTVTVPTYTLAPGTTGDFVFTGQYDGLNAMPTGFMLGSTMCNSQAVGVTSGPLPSRTR